GRTAGIARDRGRIGVCVQARGIVDFGRDRAGARRAGASNRGISAIRAASHMNEATLIAVDIGNSATKVGWFDLSGKHSAAKEWLDRTKEIAAEWLHLSGKHTARKLPRPLATSKFSTGEQPPDALAH